MGPQIFVEVIQVEIRELCIGLVEVVYSLQGLEDLFPLYTEPYTLNRKP